MSEPEKPWLMGRVLGESEPKKPWLVEILDRVAAWFATTARIGAAMHVRFEHQRDGDRSCSHCTF